MKLFEDTVVKIFKKADVDPTKNLRLFDECITILHQKMAQLSVTHGLTYERARLFDEQKQALVDDLKRMKKKGQLRA
jgi:hypothetical protein